MYTKCSINIFFSVLQSHMYNCYLLLLYSISDGRMKTSGFTKGFDPFHIKLRWVTATRKGRSIAAAGEKNSDITLKRLTYCETKKEGLYCETAASHGECFPVRHLVVIFCNCTYTFRVKGKKKKNVFSWWSLTPTKSVTLHPFLVQSSS